ncbi:hypothetical protein M3J07_011128 [Ascochyta lentis]
MSPHCSIQHPDRWYRASFTTRVIIRHQEPTKPSAHSYPSIVQTTHFPFAMQLTSKNTHTRTKDSSADKLGKIGVGLELLE